MNDKHFDVIVLGCGGMGSATLFELARRGRRVLGLEQFDLVHKLGSSHGHTRVIRKAYYEHPNYVPLVQRALERWYDLEQVTGRHLLTECGCLSLGLPGSEMIQGVQQSAREHRLSVELFSQVDVKRRFPVFQIPEDYVGVLGHDAGFLYVEDCVRSHLEAAQRSGAEIHANEPVLNWRPAASGVEVRTERERYFADRLVVTAGPWAGQMLAAWGEPLTVMRQTLHWFGTADDSQFRRDRFPIYLAEVPEGIYYGLPAIDANGPKVARHYGAPELPDVGAINRIVTAEDELQVRGFLNCYLPAVNGPQTRADVCIYTLTPDRHFILDLHPEHSQVAIAAGFSGHGFKFASVVGEFMADLVEHGRTQMSIEMFRLGRFKK
ncbi:MAG TPA: N-methyl-L-tryptophan oxidase [Gemmataceae bacterium]|nr:N-methyl-L-tryptophan oxidase [Gemmataceae bacterium]